MAAPCVSTFVDGNEAITRTRDLEVPLPSPPNFLTLLHLPRRSQIFYTVHIWIHS